MLISLQWTNIFAPNLVIRSNMIIWRCTPNQKCNWMLICLTSWWMLFLQLHRMSHHQSVRIVSTVIHRPDFLLHRSPGDPQGRSRQCQESVSQAEQILNLVCSICYADWMTVLSSVTLPVWQCHLAHRCCFAHNNSRLLTIGYAIRSVCLSFCVYRSTAEVISRFHSNLMLWVALPLGTTD